MGTVASIRTPHPANDKKIGENARKDVSLPPTINRPDTVTGAAGLYMNSPNAWAPPCPPPPLFENALVATQPIFSD